MSASIEKPNMKVQGFLDQMSTDFLYTRRMELKDWIKDRRKKLGLTQEQLAEHFERSKATISAWENGGYEPTFEQIVWLYHATGKELPPPGLETVAAPPSNAQQDILHTFVISSALKNLEKIAAKNLSEVKSLLYLTEQLTAKEDTETDEKLLDLVRKNAARAREQLDRLADLSRSEEDAREEQSRSAKKSNTN